MRGPGGRGVAHRALATLRLPGRTRVLHWLIAGLRTRAVHLAPLTRPVKCAPRDCEAKGVKGRSYGTTVDAPRPYFAQNGPIVHVEAPRSLPNRRVRRAEWRRGGVVDLRSRIRPNRRVINEAPGGRATTGARQARFFSL